MVIKIDNNIIIGIIVVLVIIIILGNFGGYGLMGGYNSSFMLFGLIFNILIIILIIAGAYWLVKNVDFKQRRR